MASNHLWMNLARRVETYVKWRYPDLKGFWRGIANAVANPGLSEVALPHAVKPDAVARRVQALAIVQELRSLLPKKESTCSAHETLRVYYRILTETEAAKAAHEAGPASRGKFKGKTFTMLPTKAAYTTSFVPISSMFFKSLMKNAKLVRFAGDGREVNSRQVWAKFLNLNAFETRTRCFDDRIVTDGCAVGVQIAKLSCVVCCPEHRCGCEGAGPPPTAMTLPPGCNVVGVDPGFTDVVAVAQQGSDKVRTYSSAKYYEKAKINLSRRRTSRWNAETKETVDALPPLRSDKESMDVYVKAHLASVDGLLAHRMRRGYRNMRFLRYVHRQKAIDEICDLVAPKGSTTVVGFGNWNSGGSPISRRCCGPVEAIKLELQKRKGVAAFVSVHEFRTSITCHRCQGRLTNMRGITTRVKTQGEARVRTVTRGKVHKVLHCIPSEGNPKGCGASWNRDVNGSKNILKITMCFIQGASRPEAFCRPSTVQSPTTRRRPGTATPRASGHEAPQCRDGGSPSVGCEHPEGNA